MDHEVRKQARHDTAVVETPSAVSDAAFATSPEDASCGFDEAVDLLGIAAQDASMLVAANARHLAETAACNDRIERLVG